MPTPKIILHQVNNAAQIEAAHTLFLEYAGTLDVDLEYQGFTAELAILPQPYGPPSGALFVAEVEGEAAGCIGLRSIGNGVAEIKRLYVRPAFRKLGLGAHLVEVAIQAAKEAGCAEIRLDTLANMVSAHVLYERLGFVTIAPYGDNYLPGTRFYGLKLKP